MRLGLGLGIAAPSIWRRHNGGPVLDADAEAYIARAGVTAEPYLTGVRALVPRIKGFGIWSKLDWLLVLPNESGTAARKNLIKDDFHLTLVNGPTFNAGQGYTFANNKYGLVDFVPSTDAVAFQLNFGTAFVWAESAPASPPTGIGCMLSGHQGNGQRGTRVWPGSGGNFSTMDVSNGNQSAFAAPAPSSYTGYLASLRTASNAVQFRRNQSQVATSTAASTGLSSCPPALGCDYYDSGFTQFFFSGQLSFAGQGGLTAEESDNLYIALAEYRATVGLT